KRRKRRTASDSESRERTDDRTRRQLPGMLPHEKTTQRRRLDRPSLCASLAPGKHRVPAEKKNQVRSRQGRNSAVVKELSAISCKLSATQTGLRDFSAEPKALKKLKEEWC